MSVKKFENLHEKNWYNVLQDFSGQDFYFINTIFKRYNTELY